VESRQRCGARRSRRAGSLSRRRRPPGWLSLVPPLGRCHDQLRLCQAAARVRPSRPARAASSACSRRKTYRFGPGRNLDLRPHSLGPDRSRTIGR
jgi:hypothetical protein